MLHVNFVVLTSSRTGSTWLIDVLNMQPGIEAHGELFLDQHRSTPAIAGRQDYRRFIDTYGAPGLKRVPNVFSYLNKLYRSPSTVGFKLMYTHLRRFPEILAYFVARRVRVVHLIRNNFIDVIVSEELARLTGASHVPAGSKIVTPKVEINTSTLLDEIRKRSRRIAQVRLITKLTALPCLEVTYEALLENEIEFERILKFLGSSNSVVDAQSKIEKRGVRSHRESIANYDEVNKALSSTPFSIMLK